MKHKVAVVYWSGTGNTAAMADAVSAGAKAAGAEVAVLKPREFSAADLAEYDAVAFGCPSMGAEVLEIFEFEPMFAGCEHALEGKNVALFGSYGWGNGEWMRDWDGRCREKGAVMAHDYVICSGRPNAGELEQCRALGAALAA